MIDHFNSDILVQVILFLNVLDSSSFSKSSKRLCYLVDQLRILQGPQLVAEASDDLSGSYKACLLQLTSPPNLALSFGRPGLLARATFRLDSLPKSAVCVGVESAAGMQANIGDIVDCNSRCGLMVGSFLPERTQIIPFLIDEDEEDENDEILTWNKLSSIGSTCKAIMVYACGVGADSVERIVHRLQALNPAAAIVGGICSSGFVSEHDVGKQRVGLKVVRNGIFGVAFAGDVPVRSIVSRGVKSAVYEKGEASSWRVHDSSFVKPSDEAYYFRGPPEYLRPYHKISSIRNVETDSIMSPIEYFFGRQVGGVEFVGLKRPQEDGFELHPVEHYSLQTNCLILFTEGPEEQEETYEGASIDGFLLDGNACLQDMDSTLEKLHEQTKNESIVGAIMVSCNGRGPQPGRLLPEKMADAQRFHNHFPGVPCLGFYAMGEIGPTALVGNENVFQSGKASVQGFTAVFALFILPAVEPGSFQIDDGVENVSTFVQSKLQNATSA